MKNIIAGLLDGGTDFIKYEGNLYCVHGGKAHKWPDFPINVLEIIEQDMLKNPEALKSLSQWENLLPEEFTYRYIVCRFGGIDDQPDIDANGKISHTEYYECGLRGKCRFEGKLCSSIKVDFGILTKAEVEVLRYVTLTYKEIAEKLFISPETVSTHLQNLRIKTGLKNNSQLAVYAHQKGIYNV